MKKHEIKKVLLALDYDETAQKTAEIGYALAKTMNAEITLLHVIYEQPAYYSGYGFMQELHVDFLADLKQSNQDFLNKMKKKLGDDSIKTLVLEGVVADSILFVAEELEVDLIVMGTHSRKWLENILMGSVVEQVLKKTAIPLFVVPTRKNDD